MLLAQARLFLLIIVWSVIVNAQSPAPDAAGAEFFEKKIRPVLTTRCYPCHSAATPKAPGGLRLDSRDGLRKGGNSGAPIAGADPDVSLLIKALRYTDPALKMPPGKPLSPETVADFEAWVRMGAPDPRNASATASAQKPGRDFWSFQKPVMPAVPHADSGKWARTAIDQFILARLQAAKLTPSPETDKRTLLRRASYDLTGLPPTIKEIQDFVKDTSPNAYEKEIDRLLASAQYGERWGRHWLDVSRYADTSDGGARFAFSYTYRDWVIRAMNEDMPYDEFVMKQVAADQMSLRDQRDLAALGFITLGRSVPKGEHDMIDDRIDAVTRGLLGLTVTCARCHDHKFDPIPTRDYYSFYGIIANSVEPVEYPLLGNEDPNSAIVQRYREGMERRLKAIDDFKTKRHAELVAEYRQASWISRYMLAARRAAKMSNTEIEKLSREQDYNLYALRRWRDYLNEARENSNPVFDAWNAFPAVPANGNSEIAQAIKAKPPASIEDLANIYGEVLAKFDGEAPRADAAGEALRMTLRGPGTPTNIPLADFMKIRGAGGDDNIIRGLNDAVRIWQAQYGYRGLPPRAMALEDSAQPVPAHVFIRGNPNNLGVETPPHFLTVLSTTAPQPFTKGSGRLGLASAIANKDNPLTARVIVNRVWQWHFGRGLVGTPSDFGTRGDAPTHPELLDYLAVRFMDEGWSLKKLHKWIMLSSAYRQSSADRPDARGVDPENKLLWRMNRQRLDYESLRDSTLLAAGQLDRTMGGLPFSLTALPAVPRRTIYAYIERSRLPGELNAFDFANPESHTPQRFQTTAPQQALFLMNSPFIAEEAKHLIAREEIQYARETSARIRALYRIVFGRDPNTEELQLGAEYVSRTNDSPQPISARTPWQYGLGEFKAEGLAFQPFGYFSMQKWEPASLLPQPVVGNAGLTATGGTPPDDPKRAVVRRWISPVSGEVEITGAIGHKIAKDKGWGDGVRARIILNGKDALLEQTALNQKAPMTVKSIQVQPGDTIDFVVDCLHDSENDDFTWSPVVQMKGAPKPTYWSALAGFHGPGPLALTVWEKYAQVLLETNEFAFID